MEEDELEIFNKIKIGIASDEKIREWSKGEVKKQYQNIADAYTNLQKSYESEVRKPYYA